MLRLAHIFNKQTERNTQKTWSVTEIPEIPSTKKRPSEQKRNSNKSREIPWSENSLHENIVLNLKKKKRGKENISSKMAELVDCSKVCIDIFSVQCDQRSIVLVVFE